MFTGMNRLFTLQNEDQIALFTFTICKDQNYFFCVCSCDIFQGRSPKKAGRRSPVSSRLLQLLCGTVLGNLGQEVILLGKR